VANVQAEWVIELNCECPSCKKDVDLTVTDDFWDGLQPAEDRKDMEAVCPECGHEFIVDCVY
jgi:DNA-directed RNA polymerase subunit RPC12/RpoP